MTSNTLINIGLLSALAVALVFFVVVMVSFS